MIHMSNNKNNPAMRAAWNMRELTTRAEKVELAHELCRYMVALLGGKASKKK